MLEDAAVEYQLAVRTWRAAEAEVKRLAAELEAARKVEGSAWAAKDRLGMELLIEAAGVDPRS